MFSPACVITILPEAEDENSSESFGGFGDTEEDANQPAADANAAASPDEAFDGFNTTDEDADANEATQFATATAAAEELAGKTDDSIRAELGNPKTQKDVAGKLALASLAEAAAAAAAAADPASATEPPVGKTVGAKTVQALGGMLGETATAAVRKAAVRALSALTSASGGNAEQVAKDDTTLNALVDLSASSSAEDSADATTIRLHAAKAMANMSSSSDTSSSNETTAAVLKDAATAENIITSALAVKIEMVKNEEVTSTLTLADAEKLMHRLQQNQLSFETVELAHGMAEGLTSSADDSGMAETLLKSSFESLVGMVAADNVQTAVSAAATLKQLLTIVPATSSVSLDAKRKIVKAMQDLAEKPLPESSNAVDRLNALVPPTDLLVLLSASSSSSGGGGGGGATMTEEPAFKLMQTTIAHMQEKFEEFEVMLKGASAS
eukprot:gene24386-14391_t